MKKILLTLLLFIVTLYSFCYADSTIIGTDNIKNQTSVKEREIGPGTIGSTIEKSNNGSGDSEFYNGSEGLGVSISLSDEDLHKLASSTPITKIIGFSLKRSEHLFPEEEFDRNYALYNTLVPLYGEKEKNLIGEALYGDWVIEHYNSMLHDRIMYGLDVYSYEHAIEEYQPGFPNGVYKEVEERVCNEYPEFKKVHDTLKQRYLDYYNQHGSLLGYKSVLEGY